LKILIEVDHLQGVSTPYLQIKGTNKDIVTSAGSALSLDGSYTTKVWLGFLKSINAKHSYIYSLFLFSVSWFLGAMQSYLQIILESLPADGNASIGIHNQQAARLQELVEFIQSQVCCCRYVCKLFVHHTRKLP
jgi:hypothetical protein